MNLLFLGGALLGAMLSVAGPDVPTTPVKTPVSAPVWRQPVQPAREMDLKIAQAPVAESEDRGWMTRDIIVDQKTGKTTEVSVIGFAD